MPALRRLQGTPSVAGILHREWPYGAGRSVLFAFFPAALAWRAVPIFRFSLKSKWDSVVSDDKWSIVYASYPAYSEVKAKSSFTPNATSLLEVL
jgi:hypothetical protein